MKAYELGEFGLIERLASVLAAEAGDAPGDRLAVGIGDDAAVWRSGAGAIVATTDTLVANVHFLPERTPWRDLGWKAIAVNVSDIAAMGATPDVALVTLALPKHTDTDDLDELYRGLANACSEYGVTLAGGDVVRAPTMALTVALTGHAALDDDGEPLVLRRSTAQAGDVLAVTGELGGAAGGLHLLQNGSNGSEAARSLIARHLRPRARPAAGSAALAAGVRCGLDVSDGLMQDLGHICRMSALGAVVWSDKVPVDSALDELFEPDEALQLAVSGGEDYELLLTGAEDQLTDAGRKSGVAITVIGEMVIDEQRRASLLDENGREIELASTGWDHLNGRG